MDLEQLKRIACQWADLDPDPVTRSEALVLIASNDEAALAEQFGQRLQFGTAGIRGALGAGPNRMNRALVRRVCTGLGNYLKSQFSHDISVVIGFDGRHGSREFAEDTAAVLGAMGLVTYIDDEVMPTPRLAHALTSLKANAGVMVTASHNPPEDNGYKVYWANGAQIVPPHDQGISDAIDAVDPASIEVPPLDELRKQNRVRAFPAAVKQSYIDAVLGLRIHKGRGIKAVYTAMHGVGYATLAEVLANTEHQIVPVEQQRAPDARFPTVRFPNPEEPGALDLAMQKAEQEQCNLIIAHDPDADRLAVAIKRGGSWRQLSGNQVGTLLADDLLANAEQRTNRVVSTTIVSSVLLSKLAEHYKVAYAETLTGFKWIANKALDLEKKGYQFVMGYEEALGYSIGPVVRDKDGISAALILLDLAAHCAREGGDLLDRLTTIYRRHGYYGNVQHSVKMAGSEGAKAIEQMMSGLRNQPPIEIAGTQVLAYTDVLTGRRTTADGQTTAVDLPKSNVLCFDLEDGSRVLARPSGTEPKIKFYLEVRVPMTDAEDLTSAEQRAQDRISPLREALLKHIGIR